MIVSIWKPIGPTSHDIVDQIRKITDERRVGHAGTLDPLAEGVLIIAITRQSTKKISEFMNLEKEYRAEITLGQTSTTDDREAEKIVVSNQESTLDEIKIVIQQFVGTIDQTPPAFSAIKIKGKKSYELARQGKTIELKPRPVIIHSIKILNYDYPKLTVEVTCGKGTYIRSLARDIGAELKTGAYMSALTRTRIGNFDKHNSVTVEEFAEQWRKM